MLKIGQPHSGPWKRSKLTKRARSDAPYYRCPGQSNMNLSNYLNTRKWTGHANIDFVQVARNHPPFMSRLSRSKNLPVHDGCVNTICWNNTGEYILSGSDDCHLCITKPGDMFDDKIEQYTVLHRVPTNHLGNIFCARFIPNSADKRIVSCSSQGPIIVHDIESTDPSKGILTFNCHSETIYEVEPVAEDDKVFLSCGEDKTIRLFDMRVHGSCARAGTCPHPALIRNCHAIVTLNLHPTNSNLFLVGRADGLGLVYDRRKLPDVTKFTRELAHAERIAGNPGPSYQFKHPLEGVVSQFSVPDMEEKCRFTSLCYNKDASEVLASYSGDYIYLFNHDRSSNFELVQTIPKRNKPATMSFDDNNTSDQNSDNSTNSADTRDRSSNFNEDRSVGRGERNRAARSPRANRISRIRLRSDWSDTGVNSVPLSSRRGEGVSVRGALLQTPRSTSLLEQVAVTFSQRSNTANRLMTAEIVSEPQERRSQSSGETESNLPGESITEDEEDTEDFDIGSDESGRQDEGNEDFEQYAEFTVRNIVNEANEQAQRIMSNDDESAMMDLDEGVEPGEVQQQRTTTEMGASRERREVSSSARAKFKKTLEGLKNKFSKIPSFEPRVKYQGHRNSRTSVKESIFWGDDYIMSGSDCGRIMVWEKETAKLVMAFQGDERVVNCLAPCPSSYVLATSGIDYDIKLWSTQGLEMGPLVIEEAEMKRIVENNELMLEESRYTLSVPPHLFFRVLASMVQTVQSSR